MNSVQEMKRIAIYIRVSTDRQAKNNLSLEDQRRTIIKWASENDAEVVNIYEDAGYSGYKGVRPSFEQMINDVVTQAINIKYIVAYDLSRFSRKEIKRISSEEILEKSGVKLVTLMDGIPEDEDTAFIVKGVNGLFNEQFSRAISKRSSIRLNQTAMDGFHTGGPTPFGYQSVIAEMAGTNKTRKKLIPVPEEAEVVKTIFEMASTGKCGIRYGTKLIATELNETGVLKRGKRWTPNSVHRILRDKAYFGERVIGKNRIRNDLNPEVVIVKVPAIIEKSLFELVDELLKRNSPDKKEHQALGSPSLLTGLAKCHYCGCNFIINTGKGGKYKYYKCRDCIKESIHSCKNKPIPKEKLERAVINELREHLFIEPIITGLLGELKSDIQVHMNKLKIKLLGLNKRKTALDQKHYSLIDKIAESVIDINEYVQRNLDTYKNEMRQTDIDIKQLKMRMSLPIKKFGPSQTKLFVEVCRKIILGGNEEATKALLNAVIDKIDIEKNEIMLEGNKLKMMATIASYEPGHSQLRVPNLISIWRRGWDSNPR
jgi:site-specific DNA recombinase